MTVEIKNRFTGNNIVSGEYESVKDCIDKNRGADLGGADLEGAKGYVNSHDYFIEAVRRQKVTLFAQAEWAAIAQIVIHRLCWDTIKKRFSNIMPSIFKKLADAGFDEWLKYWEEMK